MLVSLFLSLMLLVADAVQPQRTSVISCVVNFTPSSGPDNACCPKGYKRHYLALGYNTLLDSVWISYGGRMSSEVLYLEHIRGVVCYTYNIFLGIDPFTAVKCC